MDWLLRRHRSLAIAVLCSLPIANARAGHDWGTAAASGLSASGTLWSGQGQGRGSWSTGSR